MPKKFRANILLMLIQVSQVTYERTESTRNRQPVHTLLAKLKSYHNKFIAANSFVKD